jgi:hypothetical protein
MNTPPQQLKFDLPFYDPSTWNDCCTGKSWHGDLANNRIPMSDDFWETATKAFRLSMELKFGDELKHR